MSVYPLVAGFSPGPVRLLLTHGVRTKMKPHILLFHQHLCGLTVTLRSAMRTGGQHVYRIATAKSATDGMEGGHHLDQRPLRETAWMMPQQVSKSWSPQRAQGVHPKPPWTVKRLTPHFQQSADRSKLSGDTCRPQIKPAQIKLTLQSEKQHTQLRAKGTYEVAHLSRTHAVFRY